MGRRSCLCDRHRAHGLACQSPAERLRMITAVTSRPLTSSRQISAFEFWPGWLFYTPVVIFWILLGIRYRSFTLPTAANPRVETGGLCGERKSTILDDAGPDAAPWIAPYVILTTGDDDLARLLRLLAAAQISLPLVVKPNIGCNGTGVRLVETIKSLKSTLEAFPRAVELMVQELVAFEGEAGIFYIRDPEAASGRITSLTLKHAPILIGNGYSTVRELMLQDERTRQIPEIYAPRLKDHLDRVLSPGEALRLVFAGNHCKGSIFSNGNDDITSALTARIDTIIRDLPDFHFGRLDVRFQSRAALRAGKDFRIIEINGVGSEATHIWDRNTRLWAAYNDQFQHYRAAFRIGAQMRKHGVKPTSVRELFAFWQTQRRLMASYPLND